MRPPRGGGVSEGTTPRLRHGWWGTEPPSRGSATEGSGGGTFPVLGNLRRGGGIRFKERKGGGRVVAWICREGVSYGEEEMGRS